MADESALRDEICRVGASLHARGYVHATAGNISARLPDGWLITPTDASLGTLDPARLARLDAQGRQVGGDTASKTLALHRRIYDAAPGAHCVIHTHSTHLVALTLQGVWGDEDILPPITPYFVMKVGHVPLIAYHRPGDPAVGDAVAARIAQFAARGTPPVAPSAWAGGQPHDVDERRRRRLADDHAHHQPGDGGAGADGVHAAGVPARPAQRRAGRHPRPRRYFAATQLWVSVNALVLAALSLAGLLTAHRCCWR
jgi:hypothetical protein